MSRLWRGVTLFAALLFGSSSASAFSIGSSVTQYCHERITYKAFGIASPLAERIGSGLDAARDEAFVLFGDYLADRLGIELKDDFERLVVTSLFVGVRYPDQGAFSTFDLSAMRAIHLDQGHQAGHFLRDTHHDGPTADEDAVRAGRAFIRERVEQVVRDLRLSGGRVQVTEVKFFLEHYGQVELLVWKPLFDLGEAVHALEDSFAHTVRSDDGREIIAVANFVEPFLGDYQEARDGPPHSNVLDACDDPRVVPHADLATQATAQLFAAVRESVLLDEMTPVDRVLDQWLGYRPGCDLANDYCSSEWAALGASDPTTPPLGCTALPLGGGWWLLLAVWMTRRRRCTGARPR